MSLSSSSSSSSSCLSKQCLLSSFVSRSSRRPYYSYYLIHSSSSYTTTTTTTTHQCQPHYYYLTNSLFRKACECPRKLRYALNPQRYPTKTTRAKTKAGEKTTTTTAATQGDGYAKFLAKESHKVRLYSRSLFPNGRLIGGDDDDGHGHDDDGHEGFGTTTVGNLQQEEKKKKKTLQELAQETRTLLLQEEEKEIVLFDGVIQSGPYMIQTDIIQKIKSKTIPGRYDLHLFVINAKSWDSSKTTTNKNDKDDKDKDDLLLLLNKKNNKKNNNNQRSIQSTFLPYIRNVAFQKYVLQHAFTTTTTTLVDDENEDHDHKNNNNDDKCWFANICTWLVLPDKAKIYQRPHYHNNNKISNLNVFFSTKNKNNNVTLSPTMTQYHHDNGDNKNNNNNHHDDSSPNDESIAPSSLLSWKSHWSQHESQEQQDNKDWMLLERVNVDHVVDRVLKDDPFVVPGWCSSSGESGDGGASSSFETTVQGWADYVNSINNNNNNNDTANLVVVEDETTTTNQQKKRKQSITQTPPPPPLGSQCRTCEYRIQSSSSSSLSSSSSSSTAKNIQYSTTIQPLLQEEQSGPISGFEECWKEAMALNHHHNHQERNLLCHGSTKMDSTHHNNNDKVDEQRPRHKLRPVIDLWNGSSKQIQTFLSKQKYTLNDLQLSDLDLDENGNNIATDKNKTTITTRMKQQQPKNRIQSNKTESISPPPQQRLQGMTRAQRQWYQVTLEKENENEVVKIKDKNNNNKLQDQHDSWNNPIMVVLDRDYLQQEMDQWIYPLHFIDFETITPALPYCIGKRPYDIMAFQFSHHVMIRRKNNDNNDDDDKNDPIVIHANEFLFTESGQCPNTFFLQALAKALRRKYGNKNDDDNNDNNNDNNIGTVFRWGAHENTVLSTLLRQHQQDQQEQEVETLSSSSSSKAVLDSDTITFLESLLSGGSRSMVDLMSLATKGYYVTTKYHDHGSVSLKQLLLPTIAASQQLQDIYSQTTYSSNNFHHMQWIQRQQQQHGLGGGGGKQGQDAQTTKQQQQQQFQWDYQDDAFCDPYKLVLQQQQQEQEQQHDESHNQRHHQRPLVAHGEDAIQAYHQLQQLGSSCTHDDDDGDNKNNKNNNAKRMIRSQLEKSLLRYCELDTLAMAMIVQAWQGFLSHQEEDDDDDYNFQQTSSQPPAPPRPQAQARIIIRNHDSLKKI